jgi:hypothetical protein
LVNSQRLDCDCPAPAHLRSCVSHLPSWPSVTPMTISIHTGAQSRASMLRSYQLSDQLSIEALHSIMERRGTIHLENSTGQSRTPGHANTRAVLTLTTLTSAPLSIKSAAMSPGFEQNSRGLVVWVGRAVSAANRSCFPWPCATVSCPTPVETCDQTLTIKHRIKLPRQRDSGQLSPPAI